MPAKRTDKILDLLDATLQSTSPHNTGMPVGDPDLCLCCQRKPCIEGRSWCEDCLPEENDTAPEIDPHWLDRPGGGIDWRIEDEEDDSEAAPGDAEIYETVQAALRVTLDQCREAEVPPPLAITVWDADTGEPVGFAVNVPVIELMNCSADFADFLARMHGAVADYLGTEEVEE